MFSIAEWLDSVKASAKIESDYGLAKRLGKNQSAVTNWRNGRSMPDDESIALLCEISGEDFALLVARVQALRASSDKTRALWERLAMRLQGGGVPVLELVLIAISLVAFYPGQSWASAPPGKNQASSLYIMLTKLFVRLRRWFVGMMAGFRVSHVPRPFQTARAVFAC